MIILETEEAEMTTSQTYDKLGGRYLTASTTTVFRTIQNEPLLHILKNVREEQNCFFDDTKYLVVGAGPEGNLDDIIHLGRLTGYYWDEIDLRNIDFVDSSSEILNLCEKYIRKEGWQLTGKSSTGKFILGSAESLTDVIEENSINVIVAALCDHFDQKKFFDSAYRVLRQGGALVTTYPADGINRVVREQIYHIDPDFTRFVISGQNVLVPSKLMTPERLRKHYKKFNFANVNTGNIYCEDEEPSKTILEALSLANAKLAETPILVKGVGFKPL